MRHRARILCDAGTELEYEPDRSESRYWALSTMFKRRVTRRSNPAVEPIILAGLDSASPGFPLDAPPTHFLEYPPLNPLVVDTAEDHV
jgi:hypothetical protein